MNNYERIKNMSVEEMAAMLVAISNCSNAHCESCPLAETDNCTVSGVLEWLESEVSDDER